MTYFKEVIKLVGIKITKDELLQEIEEPVERDVFANKKSVSQSEFFNAGQNGLKAQYVFEIWLVDYNYEEKLIYNGKEYNIYRTYEKGDRIELYCEKRVGD